MEKTTKLLELEDFNGNWDAFMNYLSKGLKDSVFEIAKKTGRSPQDAFNQMLDGSRRYARRLKHDRIASQN